MDTDKIYEISRWAYYDVQKILQKESFSIKWKMTWFTKETTQDLVQEAATSIVEASRKHPQHKDNRFYMKRVAMNAIWECLLGNHKVVKQRTSGLLLSNGISCKLLEAWKLREDCRDFIAENTDLVYEALLNLRIRKGGQRASSAALRDLEIVRYASLGWSNSEIGKELSISADNVKKYRQNIVKKLSKHLEETKQCQTA